MRAHGMKMPPQRVRIAVPHARETLEAAMRYFIGQEGREAVWLPEYDKVAAWLSGNQGRGLFLFGNCGRGKSVLCRHALPAILLECCRKVVSVFDMQDMNRDIDLVLSKHILALDDIGTEQMSVRYGDRRMAFCEIADEAEKKGKLLMLTTNLTLNQIAEKYGERTMDRLVSVTKRIQFTGESLRG